MKRLLVILFTLVALAAPRLQAQEETYRFDVGAQVGMAGYLGDASSNIFGHPGFSGGVSWRYLPDARWAVRALLNVMSLSGDTADMDDVLPGQAQYSFKSTAYDLGGRVEFNFFSYGIGESYKKLRRWRALEPRSGVYDDQSVLRPCRRRALRSLSDQKFVYKEHRLVLKYLGVCNI